MKQVDYQLLNLAEETSLVQDEQLQLLYKYIDRLNVIEKGIILLYLEGKSYDEIATITGFTVSNVGTRLGRIKQKLKNKMKILCQTTNYHCKANEMKRHGFGLCH